MSFAHSARELPLEKRANDENRRSNENACATPNPVGLLDIGCKRVILQCPLRVIRYPNIFRANADQCPLPIADHSRDEFASRLSASRRHRPLDWPVSLISC